MSTEHTAHSTGHTAGHLVPFKHVFIGSIVASVLFVCAAGASGYFYLENTHLVEDKAALSAKITDLESEKVALQSDVSSLSTQVEDLGGKVESLNSTNSNLNSKVGSLNSQVSDLNGQLALSSDAVSFLADFSTELANKFDEMDSLLLRNDSNSYDYIQWLLANGYIYGDINTANYMHSSWESTQNQLNNEYQQIQYEVYDLIDALNAYAGI